MPSRVEMRGRCLCVRIHVCTALLSGREYSAAGQMPREISSPSVSKVCEQLTENGRLICGIESVGA